MLRSTLAARSLVSQFAASKQAAPRLINAVAPLAARSISTSITLKAEDDTPAVKPKAKRSTSARSGTKKAVSSDSEPKKPRASKKAPTTNVGSVKAAKKPKKAVKPAAAPRPKKALKLPKQITSIWMLYSGKRMKEMKAEAPKDQPFKPSQAMGEIASEYRQLGASAKEDLAEELEKVKADYAVEYAEFLKNISPADIKLENQYRRERREAKKSNKRNFVDPNKPKRPLTAFFIYLDSKRADASWVEEAKSQASADSTDAAGKAIAQHTRELTAVAKKAGDEWRAMSEDEKKAFHDQAQQSKQRYFDQMVAYNEAHKVSGPVP